MLSNCPFSQNKQFVIIVRQRCHTERCANLVSNFCHFFKCSLFPKKFLKNTCFERSSSSSSAAKILAYRNY